MSDRAHGCVFLLTDYGLSDELAGVLKGVIAKRAPNAAIVDLTHGIPAFDVRAGALALARAIPHLGPGVVVGVVDPGVGSGNRRAVALATTATARPEERPSYLVGPDNGLLVWAAEALGGISAAVDLTGSTAGTTALTEPGVSEPHGATFDGRDVFGPAAAALWNGTPIGELGVALDPARLTRLDNPALSVRAGVIDAEVLWVDAFGNVQLSALGRHAAAAGFGDRVEVRTRAAKTSTGPVSARRIIAFAELGEGELGIIVDSNGHLALVGDRSSAALALGLAAQDQVTLLGVP